MVTSPNKYKVRVYFLSGDFGEWLVSNVEYEEEDLVLGHCANESFAVTIPRKNILYWTIKDLDFE